MNKETLLRHIEQIEFSSNSIWRNLNRLSVGNVSHISGTLMFEVNFILQKLQEIKQQIKGEIYHG